jgi:hypothetical protein
MGASRYTKKELSRAQKMHDEGANWSMIGHKLGRDPAGLRRFFAAGKVTPAKPNGKSNGKTNGKKPVAAVIRSTPIDNPIGEGDFLVATSTGNVFYDKLETALGCLSPGQKCYRLVPTMWRAVAAK